MAIKKLEDHKSVQEFFNSGLEKQEVKPDMVNHPPHYKQGPIEVIEIIRGFNCTYCIGNVIKYLLRAPHKGTQIEDLKKARWYLDYEIRRLEGNAN